MSHFELTGLLVVDKDHLRNAPQVVLNLHDVLDKIATFDIDKSKIFTVWECDVDGDYKMLSSVWDFPGSRKTIAERGGNLFREESFTLKLNVSQFWFIGVMDVENHISIFRLEIADIPYPRTKSSSVAMSVSKINIQGLIDVWNPSQTEDDAPSAPPVAKGIVETTSSAHPMVPHANECKHDGAVTLPRIGSSGPSRERPDDETFLIDGDGQDFPPKEYASGVPISPSDAPVCDHSVKEENPLSILFKPINSASMGYLPSKSRHGDTGLDLYVVSPGSIKIPPKAISDVPTGFQVKIPEGYWGSIKARSSTFANRGLIVMEGVIDPNYTGELSVLVYNPLDSVVAVKPKERLAQLILIPKIDAVPVVHLGDMPKTDRDKNAFGSSGL